MKLGATSRSQLKGFQEIDQAMKIRHAHYNPATYENDIGLIRLSKKYNGQSTCFFCAILTNSLLYSFNLITNGHYLSFNVLRKNNVITLN